MLCRKRKVNLKYSRKPRRRENPVTSHRSGERPQKNLKLRGDRCRTNTHRTCGPYPLTSHIPLIPVPLTLTTTTDRTLCCEKAVRENVKVLPKERKVMFSQWSTCECLGMHVITLPPCPTHSHFTSCLLPFADLGLHYFPVSSPYQN